MCRSWEVKTLFNFSLWLFNKIDNVLCYSIHRGRGAVGDGGFVSPSGTISSLWIMYLHPIITGAHIWVCCTQMCASVIVLIRLRDGVPGFYCR